jgi:hypothetical protein
MTMSRITLNTSGLRFAAATFTHVSDRSGRGTFKKTCSSRPCQPMTAVASQTRKMGAMCIACDISRVDVQHVEIAATTTIHGQPGKK